MIDMIFDTETTKFPQWKIPNDHPDQTQLMQLGLLIVKGPEVILNWEHLVYCTQEPDPGAFNAHGITLQSCQEAGLRLTETVRFFMQRLKDVDRVVCHNNAFDTKVMCCAIAQANATLPEPEFKYDDFLSKPNVCTMLSSTEVLKLEGKFPGKWKWPTLQEAYKSLVDPAGFSGAHSAGADCGACHQVLLALQDRGVELRGAAR